MDVHDPGRRGRTDRTKPSPEPERSPNLAKLRPYVPADILNVSFPAAVRGYERSAVDAYVKRVNRVIAELKVGASPQAAVRHALDQASEKVDGLLQAAREAAEQITAAAQAEAEETTGRAKAEAAQLIVDTSAEADRLKTEADAHVANANQQAAAALDKAKAEADDALARAHSEAESILARAQTEADEHRQRVEQEIAKVRDRAETEQRAVRTDTERVRSERSDLLNDVRTMADALVEVANAAAQRLPQLNAASDDETQGAAVSTEEESETSELVSPQ